VSHRQSGLPPRPTRAPWMFLAAALILSAQLAGCQKAPPQQQTMHAIPVTVLQVEPRDVPIDFEFVAQTQSSHQVEIRARVNGFLDKRVYAEGDVVKEGQVLFLMDKKPFQARADGAAAALARQRAAMENARANLERVKPLVAQNALSQKDLEDATGSYEMAAAAVEQAKTQLQTAQLDLSYCTITSPLTGISSAALQQDGAYINETNSQLATVMALSPLWANFSLSENELKHYYDQVDSGRIRPPKGNNFLVEIVLVDGSIFPHTGRITFAAPSFNPKTGTFLFRVSFANPKGWLRPNQYVRVRLKGCIRPKAIIIPQRAVQQGAKGHFVWLVNNGKADPQPIVLGDWHGTDVFVDQGLKAGSQVVVEGVLLLQPGAPVTAKPLQVPPTTPAGPAGGSKSRG
jgi:membrane fusion protein (multidrug efflux system)